jgi:hypothetical protein
MCQFWLVRQPWSLELPTLIEKGALVLNENGNEEVTTYKHWPLL